MTITDCNCEQPENLVYNDLWEFSLETSTWKKLGPKQYVTWPSARCDHIAVSFKDSTFEIV